ncbi:DUF1285 domain-containing protein [Thalassospira sp. FZY0004]|nr:MULTISPECIES: DUF1285 domain-containing protein [Thalassospira]MDG4720484.1 DUF1285 domain-containing protein [Thalassospira sp. FZY0004]
MSIGRDGTWFYQGGPIGRIELVKLFSSVLQRDDEGGHWLVTPAEMARIEVEDVAFIAVEMQNEGSGQDQTIRFRTNIDQWVELDAAYPLRVEHDPETDEPSPYIALERGLEARLNRAVFYQLVELADEISDPASNMTRIGVYSHGQFFEIGRMETVE